MKRFSLILPLLFLVLLCGCGSEKDVPEAMPHQDFATDSAEVQNDVFRSAPAPISYPLEDAPTLTLYYPLSADALPMGDQQLLSAWEKTTGAVIHATGIPADEYQNNLNTYISADEMPDLLLSVPSYMMTEDIDALLELSDLIAEYAPNYIAAVKELDGGPQSVADSEGKLFSMCVLMDHPAVLSGFGLVLRQDWMEELGVSAPETYDDYHDLLLSIKSTYSPAQPLRIPEKGVTDYNNLCAGFGVSLGSRSANHGFYQVDGTVHYGPLEEGFSQYLTLLHQWYQEGIITSKFLDFTDFGSNSYLIELSTGDCGAFFLPITAYNTLEGMCSFPITPGMDPVQNSGDTTHLASDCATVVWGPGYSVSTTCETPDLAIMALDWLYTPEARVLSAYGTEGVSYEIAGNQPTFTALVQDDPSTQLPNYTAMTLGACIAPEIVPILSGSNVMEVWNRQKDAAYMIPQGVQMTQEDSEEYTALAADISTYIDSLIPQFITGERDLSEIPAAQEKIRSWNVDRCMELWQEALDRYYAA
jgi:putative aldouronate transport system substrate-binding protein